jgi:hypothetical protein
LVVFEQHLTKFRRRRRLSTRLLHHAPHLRERLFPFATLPTGMSKISSRFDMLRIEFECP